jgi:hypothetical protein
MSFKRRKFQVRVQARGMVPKPFNPTLAWLQFLNERKPKKKTLMEVRLSKDGEEIGLPRQARDMQIPRNKGISKSKAQGLVALRTCSTRTKPARPV